MGINLKDYYIGKHQVKPLPISCHGCNTRVHKWPFEVPLCENCQPICSNCGEAISFSGGYGGVWYHTRNKKSYCSLKKATPKKQCFSFDYETNGLDTLFCGALPQTEKKSEGREPEPIGSDW